MYVTSKRKSTNGRQDESLTWDWDAVPSGDKQERTTTLRRTKTSFFDRDRAIQTPETLSADAQKRTIGGFSVPSTGSRAKRIKVEHSSPGPFSSWPRSTPDAKPLYETTRTPAAPKTKRAGPFIIDDSDSDEDTEIQTDVVPVTESRPPTPPLQTTSRNTMPSSSQEQRAESKRLREEALIKRYGTPGGADRHATVKVEKPPSRISLQCARPMLKSEPIDLTGDDPPTPTKPGPPFNEQPPKILQPVQTPADSRMVLTVNGSQRDGPKEGLREAGPEDVRQVHSNTDLSRAPATSATALQTLKPSTSLNPKGNLPIPVAPEKDTSFNKLREILRQAESKRESELKNEEAKRAAALIRSNIADRRTAGQQEQRKQRLVEDAKKKAAVRRETADQARRETDRRRQLEKDIEQPVAEQEKKRKAQLEEQNRIFKEKRKTEKEAQERLRQQQLDKQKAAERAGQRKLHEERIQREQERNARMAQTPRESTDTAKVAAQKQASTQLAPVVLSQNAKEVARSPAHALELQPRSLQSLRAGELSKLNEDGNASALGEISLIDLKLLTMRNDHHDWPAIVHYLESATGFPKSESSLRKRYDEVTAALHKHKIPADLITRACNGEETACAKIDQRVHGVRRAAADSRAPRVRLNHWQVGPARTSNTQLEAPPQGNFVPYGNVVTSARGRPNVGGKTIDQNFFFHMLEQNHKAFIESNEDNVPAEEEYGPEDRWYYMYRLKRRNLPAGADPTDDDRYLPFWCDHEYYSLEDANSEAGKEVTRISSRDGRASLDFGTVLVLERRTCEDGMVSLTLHLSDGSIVRVEVIRDLHMRNVQQSEPHEITPTISRTCYYVKQRTTTREVDEALGTDRKLVKETLLNNSSHTSRDQANEIAINRYVYANYQFKGGSPNLSKRTELCKPQIEALRNSLVVGELFRSGPGAGESQVEVWVEEGKVAGPRNL